MVRINASKITKESPPVELGPATEVLRFHSASSPGMWHIVVVLEKPLIIGGEEYTAVCSCRGFSGHRKCWHTTLALSEDREELL